MTTSIVLELDPKLPTSVRLRCALERAILKRCAKALLDAGYTLRVHDGEDWASRSTRDLDPVMAVAFDTDECDLVVSHSRSGTTIGTVSFVFGNDGFDVISDHTVTPAIDAAVAIAEEGLS